MQLTFLQADKALTKTYKKRPDGSYESSSYPNVFKVTSHEEEAEDLEGFTAALEKHSELGNCLLTSGLDRPLVDESRAKHGLDEDRQWIMLDVDGFDGFATAEDFIRFVLPEPFHNVSYIVQHSPSSGIKSGLRVHIFFMLYTATTPSVIKAWLQYANLETQQLSDKVELSKSARGLRYPLDIVANDNSRIIYITPPTCDGFSDPVTTRIELVKKEQELLSFNFASISTPLLKQKFRDMVEALREAVGLPKTAKNAQVYTYRDDKEYVNEKYTEPARITSCQADNDRFMRVNLDGGDSWAYYYHRDQKDPWLHNFKGEPSVRISVLDPEFYEKVVQGDYDALSANDPRPFVFRDDLTDKYFAGVREADVITRQPRQIGSEKKIADYFVQFGNTSPPADIPSWERTFRPDMEGQWHPDDLVFNVWRPTEYMTNATFRTNPPETIDRVLRHVTGDDLEAYQRFTNWLAYIFQSRSKAGTAWVLHGCPGTGKGVLFNQVIRPLFGYDYCATRQVADLKSRFNEWMHSALFVNIDETNAEHAGSEQSQVIERLKLWITDPYLSIEGKGANSFDANNYTNFIFTSNDFGALPIQEGDRRFNVAPRQETPIVLSQEDIQAIAKELPTFAGYLSGYEVDVIAATKPLDNLAKTELRIAASTSVDTFVRAIRERDLMYFVNVLGDVEVDAQNAHMKVNLQKAVDRWIDDAKNDRPSGITLTEAKAAYMLASGGKTTRDKFMSMMIKRGFPAYKRTTVNGKRVAGWPADTPWELDEQDKVDLGAHIKGVEQSVEATEEEVKKDVVSPE